MEEIKILTAQEARILAQPTQKTFDEIMSSINYWAKRGDTKVGVVLENHFVTQDTLDRFASLGYDIYHNPTNEILYVSWKLNAPASAL